MQEIQLLLCEEGKGVSFTSLLKIKLQYQGLPVFNVFIQIPNKHNIIYGEYIANEKCQDRIRTELRTPQPFYLQDRPFTKSFIPTPTCNVMCNISTR